MRWTYLQQLSDSMWHARRRVQKYWGQREHGPLESNKRSRVDASDAAENPGAPAGSPEGVQAHNNSPAESLKIPKKVVKL